MSNRRFDLDPTCADEIARLSANLPPLPSTVRYYDDFANEFRTIRGIADAEWLELNLDGTSQILAFERLGPSRQVYNHVLIDWFSRFDPHSIGIQHNAIMSYIGKVGLESFVTLVTAQPFDARAHWNMMVVPNATAKQSESLRAALHSLCRLSVGHWSPSHTVIVSSLIGPKIDKFRVVRMGECFLPLDQQALVVDHIDSMCAALESDHEAVGDQNLRDVCMLVLSYQYALRPGQSARIEIADVRQYTTGAVHVAVTIIKQQDHAKRIRVTKRIKREWAPLFVELVKRREMGVIQPEKGVPPRLPFGLAPSGVSQAILELTSEVTGEGWSPTDLRHTAAQRLADGGISHVGLTEFMGHSSDRIANVYFDASPSQAKRINDALAISPIYKNVAKIATTRTIDKEMLLGLPVEKQIGGVPHGIPIAGIGGCNLGQNLCMKNPVVAFRWHRR